MRERRSVTFVPVCRRDEDDDDEPAAAADRRTSTVPLADADDLDLSAESDVGRP